MYARENAPEPSTVLRRRIDLRGRVQGVGFRPFVYRLASELRLGGFVGNDAHGAFLEIEGPAERLDAFILRLQKELPPLANVAELRIADLPAKREGGFRIESSPRGERQEAEITPDVATCAECLAELFDPRNRRYRYPFINCTNCGPRYSIIQAVPYDRPNTTMAKFIMCPACQAEYADPADRRFHAQPNACAVCGPRVWLADARGAEISGDAIRLCADLLRRGRIVAIKGLGGFHLACRADDDQAVRRLRRRKAREAKPLALMAASLEAARALAEFDEPSAAILCSVARPIVLAPKRQDAIISPHVAPAGDCFGIMLPYTPLHHLLLAESAGPLVMTSGNPAEEPLCGDNAEALARLGSIADAFLLHDRDIARRVDDSVVQAGPRGLLPIRRARGFVPAPIRLERKTDRPILAVGAELKSAVCLYAGREAVLSEHLGELSNAAAYRNFVGTIEQFKKLLRVEPEVVACDLHPAYAATRYAGRAGLAVVAVQHHHAHLVSCLADNGLSGPVLGVSCDGTGYGSDGAIWGCEVLAGDAADFQRVGHLDYFPLFGGDTAARETWRPAAGLLYETYGPDWPRAAGAILERVPPEALGLFQRRVAGPGRLPRTSSLGRLFDAAAFLLNICGRNRYEAEAAMTLEAAARPYPRGAVPAYNIINAEQADAPMQMDVRPLIRELLQGVHAGRTVGELARAFHETLAAMLANCTVKAAKRTGLNRVVLSGGCFANRLLLERLCERLAAADLAVFVHQRVPTGDGGIALGQAVAAAERIRSNR